MGFKCAVSEGRASHKTVGERSESTVGNYRGIFQIKKKKEEEEKEKRNQIPIALPRTEIYIYIFFEVYSL